jgi:hypothetical protein
MIPRLIICFGLSVLLHGLLLLALVLTLRVESKGYGQGRNAASSQLNVFLEAASNNKKPVALEPKPKKETAVAIPAPAQVKPAAVSSPPVVAYAPQRPPASGLFRQPSPDVRQQMQMDYRQMQEAQARQYALQQAQFVIGGLQADIEQRLNLHRDHVEGKCTWHDNTEDDAARFQCESKALDSRMQAETERLTALRHALRTQGTILDGFTVSANAGRAAITYHVHPANIIPAP